MMKKYCAWLVHFTIIFARRFQHDRLSYAASALTFTSLLSLVPLMTVLLSVLSGFALFHNVRQEVQQFIFNNFIPTSGAIVQKYLMSFAMQAQKLSSIGLFFLIITAMLMIFTIEGALNDIWNVSSRRHGLSAWLRYWAMLTLGPFIAGLSIATTSYVASLPLIAGAVQLLGIKAVLLECVPIVMQLFGLTFLYVVIPNSPVRWLHGFIGACVASVFFELARKGFLLYVTYFPTYQLLYGALATIPIFLLWVYLSWLIVLCGAVVTNILAVHRCSEDLGEVGGFFHAFLWLGALWQAQQEGKTLSLTNLLNLFPAHYFVPPEVMLHALRKANLIMPTEKNRYVLARDFSHFSLAQLHQALPWKFAINEKISATNTQLTQCYLQTQNLLNDQLQINMSELYQDFFKSVKVN